jgi:hypothetical protein
MLCSTNPREVIGETFERLRNEPFVFIFLCNLENFVIRRYGVVISIQERKSAVLEYMSQYRFSIE